MQFIFHPEAGIETLSIQGETYNHLYKARRTKQTQELNLRNLKDDYLYTYSQEQVTKRDAKLRLERKLLAPNRSIQKIHLILAVIDFKALCKILAPLNELGVKKLTLFYAHHSQSNEKIQFNKMNQILIHSSEQCGRSDTLKIDQLKNLQEVLLSYPEIAVFDFGGKKIEESLNLPFLVGPEGGFSREERELLKDFQTYSTQENLILRSETACIFLASKLYINPSLQHL